MPLQILKDTQAIETMKTNAGSSWPPRGSEGNRIEPLAKPIFLPTFKLTRGERIFTIGSCFARNVENALHERGFSLPARDILRTDERFAAIGPNILNNYGAPSIYNEIAWGFDSETFIPDQNFFEVDGKYVDIHLNHSLRPAPYDVVETRRAAIKTAYAGLTGCRVVIITLGLSECWFDTQTGLYLNTAPRRVLMRSHPGRFELHVLDFSETKSYLVKIFEMLRCKGHADLRVILTVSPVPLLSTYRPQDVVVANMYSKSVLRAASEEIVSQYDFVDYFPSFESILTSQRDQVWEDNLTHIKKPIIDINVARMIAGYLESDPVAGASIDDLLLRLGAPEMKASVVFGELEGRSDLLEQSPELAMLFCEAAVRLHRPKHARRSLEHCSGAPSVRIAWVEAQLAFLEADFSAAERILETWKDSFRRRHLFWRLVCDCRERRGDILGVQEAIGEWSAVFPRSAEPYRLGAKIMAKADRVREADYLFEKACVLAPESGTAVDLDYAEFLAATGRSAAARSLLSRFTPSNALQMTRCEGLTRRLRDDAASASTLEVAVDQKSDDPSDDGEEADFVARFEALRQDHLRKETARLEKQAAEKAAEKSVREEAKALRREQLAEQEHRRDRKRAAIEALEGMAPEPSDPASARRSLEASLDAYRAIGWCGPEDDVLRTKFKAASDRVRSHIEAAELKAWQMRRRWWQFLR